MAKKSKKSYFHNKNLEKYFILIYWKTIQIYLKKYYQCSFSIYVYKKYVNKTLFIRDK